MFLTVGGGAALLARWKGRSWMLCLLWGLVGLLVFPVLVLAVLPSHCPECRSEWTGDEARSRACSRCGWNSTRDVMDAGAGGEAGMARKAAFWGNVARAGHIMLVCAAFFAAGAYVLALPKGLPQVACNTVLCLAAAAGLVGAMLLAAFEVGGERYVRAGEKTKRNACSFCGGKTRRASIDEIEEYRTRFQVSFDGWMHPVVCGECREVSQPPTPGAIYALGAPAGVFVALTVPLLSLRVAVALQNTGLGFGLLVYGMLLPAGLGLTFTCYCLSRLWRLLRPRNDLGEGRRKRIPFRRGAETESFRPVEKRSLADTTEDRAVTQAPLSGGRLLRSRNELGEDRRKRIPFRRGAEAESFRPVEKRSLADTTEDRAVTQASLSGEGQPTLFTSCKPDGRSKLGLRTEAGGQRPVAGESKEI